MDWDRVGELLAAASALPEDSRGSFLDRSCAGDTELRAEIESLLQHAADDTEFVEAVQRAAADTFQNEIAPAASAGSTVGPYRLIRPLGSGGMATVWLAVRDDDEYRKEVAIKLMHVEGSPAVHARFLSERQILATFDHPNIARLLDGGTTDTGAPYVVMERVEGQPIDAFCDERGLEIRERIGLFRTVCSAVQYAHRNLVVHRDIKPSNILVTPEGAPKLLDFGIAKLLAPDAKALTATGERMLTPRYASPEQIRGQPITTASDVYSLGVLLYELLAGVSPYEPDLTDPLRLADSICRTDPTVPSISASEDWRRQIRGDLDNIVAMALRKEPERRYSSVEELSEDLHRHLIRVPVRARQATWRYQASRFLSRHRFPVAAASIALLALVAATVLSLVQVRRAETARANAERDRAIAVGEAARARLMAAQAALQGGRPVEARRLLEAAPQAQREWEWTHMHNGLDQAAAVVEAPDTVAAGFETDRTEIITLSRSGMVRWWNPFLSINNRHIDLGVSGIDTAVFSRDGSHLAAARGGEAFYWSLSSPPASSGEPPSPLWQARLERPLELALSDDGSRLAASTPKDVILWSAREGERRWQHGIAPISLSLASDGGRILMTAREGEGSYRLFDPRGNLLNTAFGRDIVAATLSPDGRIVAALESDRWVRLRDPASSRVIGRLSGHSAALIGSRSRLCPGSRVLRVDPATGDREVISDAGTGGGPAFGSLAQMYHLRPLDQDGDGLTDYFELQNGSDPLDADSDDDLIPDGADCAPMDPAAFAPPPAVTGLEVSVITGGHRFSWTDLAPVAGSGVT